MSKKDSDGDWFDQQLEMYHAPRLIGDPMSDWILFQDEQERIWQEVEAEENQRSFFVNATEDDFDEEDF